MNELPAAVDEPSAAQGSADPAASIRAAIDG